MATSTQARSERTGRPVPETQDAFSSPPANLPTIHDNETAYSWYYRIALLNGAKPPVPFSLWLFRSRYAALTHDFPNRVASMLQHAVLPDWHSMDFARRHTLAGYFLPFSSLERIALFESYINEGSPKDLKMHLGIPASRLTAIHPLKFCNNCVNTDLSELGYAYWRIEHQYPSSWICLAHDVLLDQAELTKAPCHHRHWLTPDGVTPSKRKYHANEALMHVLRKLAVYSSALTKLAPGTLSEEALSRTYYRSLVEQNLATNAGVLRLRELVPTLKSMYQPCRTIPGFHILDSISDEWAGFVGIARRRGRPAHPFKHLLLIALLFENWTEFCEVLKRPIADEAAPEVDQTEPPDNRQDIFRRLVAECELSLSEAGRQVGISPTTATQWASRLGLSYVTRTKTLDEKLLSRCRSLLRKGFSRLTIAEKLPLSPGSITRLLAREPALRRQWHAAIEDNRRRENRTAFLKLLAENPGVPLKVLRRIPGNGYMWLYRHDRDWLIAHLPTLPIADQ